jgi:hypothetical protein
MPRTITWSVDGLNDEIHGNVILQALKAVPGVLEAEVRFSQRRAGVRLADGADQSAINAALQELGKLGYQFHEEQRNAPIIQNAIPQNTEPQNVVMELSAKDRRLGWCFLLAPVLGLVLLLTVWAITSFIFSRLGVATSAMDLIDNGAVVLAPSDAGQAAARIINASFGFLGIICVLLIIPGIILGIVFLLRRRPAEGSNYDQRSGQGKASVVPFEVKGWNWGAFGLTFIWGIYHGVWISLLSFVPFVNIFVAIYLGIKGNELAWRKNRWSSVAQFQLSQLYWGRVGIIAFVMSILITFFRIVSK